MKVTRSDPNTLFKGYKNWQFHYYIIFIILQKKEDSSHISTKFLIVHHLMILYIYTLWLLFFFDKGFSMLFLVIVFYVLSNDVIEYFINTLQTNRLKPYFMEQNNRVKHFKINLKNR